MSNPNKRVGILGLGIIGSRVAANVKAAGHEVSVWNRTAQPGAEISPAVVAEKSEILQIFVRDDEALAQVLEVLLPTLGAHHIVLNHATVSPAATALAASQVVQTGAKFLDCPFTGSKMAAENAKLVYYVGGDSAVLEDVRVVLEAGSAKIMHVGETGHATILKLATNLISAVTVKGVEEALRLTTALGVDAKHLLAAEEANGNFSPLIGMKLSAMLNGEFEPHFSLKNMLKDADYALALASGKNLSAPALASVAEAMRSAQKAGLGEQDFCVIGKR